MGYCVHHIPGRARFRLPKIRGGKVAIEQIRAALADVPGFKAVEINPAAGSATVTYDPAEAVFETIAHRLRLAGLLGSGNRRSPAAAGLATQAGAMFGRALFAAVLERSISRSVTMVVGKAFR